MQRWLGRYKRFHMDFTPASAGWLNMIERFFRDLTRNRVRRRVFRGVPELVVAMQGCIAQHDQQPEPFFRTAEASDILAKVLRGRAALNTVQSV